MLGPRPTNFYEARAAPQRCGWILRQIGHLYHIEDTLRRTQAGQSSAAVRIASRPIYQRIALWSSSKVSSLPASQRHGAGHRLRTLQLAFAWLYLEDGRIQKSNRQ
jgi:hypothetical protein